MKPLVSSDVRLVAVRRF